MQHSCSVWGLFGDDGPGHGVCRVWLIAQGISIPVMLCLETMALVMEYAESGSLHKVLLFLNVIDTAKSKVRVSDSNLSTKSKIS